MTKPPTLITGWKASYAAIAPGFDIDKELSELLDLSKSSLARIYEMWHDGDLPKKSRTRVQIARAIVDQQELKQRFQYLDDNFRHVTLMAVAKRLGVKTGSRPSKADVIMKIIAAEDEHRGIATSPARLRDVHPETAPSPTKEASEYVADDRESDERETYRVAVVVFMEAKGVDHHDASNRAVRSLEHVISPHGIFTPWNPAKIKFDSKDSRWLPNGHYVETTVRDVGEINTALQRLQVVPTGRF